MGMGEGTLKYTHGLPAPITKEDPDPGGVKVAGE
jgi:hypothetical protein